MDIVKAISQELNIQLWQTEATIKLIDEGNTIPFIARYRKEAHGTLDDQTLREISERLEYLRNLDKRREEISSSITAQEKMTPELQTAIENAATLAELEDLYRPYKPKRKTRASVAKEKGLEPLADTILQQKNGVVPSELAADYIDAEKGVETVEDALQGASDIIAEAISDNADIRRKLRNLFMKLGVMTAKAAKDEDSVYSLYYEFSEKVDKLAGHKILAIDRGEREDFLKVSVTFDRIKAMEIISKVMIRANNSNTTEQITFLSPKANEENILEIDVRERFGTDRAIYPLHFVYTLK